MADNDVFGKILNIVLGLIKKDGTKAIAKELAKPESLVVAVTQPAPEVVSSVLVAEDKKYLVSMNELLNNKYKLEDQSADIQENLNILLDKINQVRNLWGKPMTATSGLRTMEDHLRIYRKKAEKEGVVFDQSKVPLKSKHLYGQAVDIADPTGALQAWCKANESVLKSIGLWLEDFSKTPGWCHFQIVPYGSYVEGKSIWFMP